MLTGPRPDAGEPSSVPPVELLRAGGQEAAIAGGIVTLVLVGVLARLLAGPVEPLGLPVLVALVATSSTSASYAVRARLTVLRALGEVRARLGAPLHPGVPWPPVGSDAALPERLLNREFRRLIGAAYRCHDLSSNALAWAFVSVVVLVVWLLI